MKKINYKATSGSIGSSNKKTPMHRSFFKYVTVKTNMSNLQSLSDDDVEKHYQLLKSGGFNYQKYDEFYLLLEYVCSRHVKINDKTLNPEEVIKAAFGMAKPIAINYIKDNILDELRDSVLELAEESFNFSTLSNALSFVTVNPNNVKEIKRAKTMLEIRKENIERGKLAIQKINQQRIDIENSDKGANVQKASELFELNVMFRPGIGWICFHEGEPGDPKLDFEGGHGLSHIRAKRAYIIQALKDSNQLDESIHDRSVDDVLNNMIHLISTCANFEKVDDTRIVIRNGKNVVALDKEKVPFTVRKYMENNRNEYADKTNESILEIKKSPLLGKYFSPGSNEAWIISSYESIYEYENKMTNTGIAESAGFASMLQRVNPKLCPRHLFTKEHVTGSQETTKSSGESLSTALRTVNLGRARKAVGAAAVQLDPKLSHDQTEGKQKMKDGIMERAAGSRYSTQRKTFSSTRPRECCQVESSLMELTLKEKFELQKIAREGMERLQASIADPDERQKVEDEVRDALDKLNGTSSVVAKSNIQAIAPIKPEVISDLSILFNDKRMIEFGERAISHLLLNNYNGEGKIKASTDAIQYAMYNKKFGWISFEWGNPGVYPPNFKDVQSKKNYFANVNPKQLFSHGYGLSHTLAKRLWEEKNIVECSGQDALEIIELIPKAIMYGNIQNKGNKIEIRYNNNVVVLAKARNTKKRGRPLIVVKDKRLLKALKKTESWLITSFLSTNTYTVNFNEIGNVFESAGVESCRRVTCGHYTGEAAHTPAPVPNKLLATWFGAHLAQPDNNAGRALYGYESGGPSHPFLSTHHEKKRWQDMVGAADSVDSTLSHDQTEGKQKMKDGIMERAAGSRYSTIFAMLDMAQGIEGYLRVIDAAFEEPEEPKELSVPTPLFDSMMAGEFDDLGWRNFAKLCERIIMEEGKAAADLRDAIRNYIQKHEPSGGYKIPKELLVA